MTTDVAMLQQLDADETVGLDAACTFTCNGYSCGGYTCFGVTCFGITCGVTGAAQ